MKEWVRLHFITTLFMNNTHKESDMTGWLKNNYLHKQATDQNWLRGCNLHTYGLEFCLLHQHTEFWSIQQQLEQKYLLSFISSILILFIYLLHIYTYIQEVFLVAQLVKNPPVMQETWVWSLGWEDLLKEGKATHSSILVCVYVYIYVYIYIYIYIYIYL